MPQRNSLHWRYPDITPYHTGRIKVGGGHELYYEESGNPKGKPVVYLHGGPGSGSGPRQRTFFHPEKYRIILFDQRGSGQSTPFASIEENTTWHLVADMEKLRQHLGLEKWMIVGGSWGSTLALAYAETHPERVTELVLRGIFLLRKQDIDWFYQRGADAIYPDTWEPYRDFIPEAERGDFVKAYYRRLTSEDKAIQLAAAKAWSIWEGTTSKLFTDPQMVADYGADAFATAFARIECHYFVHGAFFETDNWLVENVGRLRHIPAVIVQGRYDVVCPMEQCWALYRAWPEAELCVVPDAGHSAFETGISRAMVAAIDRFAVV